MPTNWIVPQLTNLSSFLAPAQVSQLSPQFADIQTAVITRIRNAISRRGIQVSGTANSVPPELLDTACWLIIEKGQTYLSGFEFSQHQLAAIKDSKSEIMSISKGEMAITVPTDPATYSTMAGGGATVVREGQQKMNLRRMNGL